MTGRSWGGAEMTGRRWEGAEMTGIPRKQSEAHRSAGKEP